MCRYAFKSYKPHYVCFDCRKTFKQPILEDIIMQNGDWDSYKQAYFHEKSEKAIKFRQNNPELIRRFEKQYRNKKYLCPDCGLEMNSIGLDFKAPKKHKVKEWEIVRSMYKIGRTFHSCGCDGPGYIPTNLKDYLSYLEKVKVDYETRLKDRSISEDEEQLAEYIDYWETKLKLVNIEVDRVKRRS
ncbi:MAG: hypothetical protein MI810_02230 [Flavobacteriales bacterium]|nr:hypothetical protein [Flavobacteriales bacterium]